MNYIRLACLAVIAVAFMFNCIHPLILAVCWLFLIIDLGSWAMPSGRISTPKKAFYMAIAPIAVVLAAFPAIFKKTLLIMLSPTWTALGDLLYQRPVLSIAIIYLVCLVIYLQIDRNPPKPTF